MGLLHVQLQTYQAAYWLICTQYRATKLGLAKQVLWKNVERLEKRSLHFVTKMVSNFSTCKNSVLQRVLS